jgi:hydrogenase expression/formation protein HypC
MCIGVPMQVLEPAGERAAWCAGRDGRRLIDLALVGPQAAGAWLLTFAGAGREVLTPEAASAIDHALDALEAALAGDARGIEAGFADLIGREPALPAHLVPAED